MSVKVQKGAVKFLSIRDMARAIAKTTGEPESRVYIRTWKRLNSEKTASQAFHAPKRKYAMNEVAA